MSCHVKNQLPLVLRQAVDLAFCKDENAAERIQSLIDSYVLEKYGKLPQSNQVPKPTSHPVIDLDATIILSESSDEENEESPFLKKQQKKMRILSSEDNDSDYYGYTRNVIFGVCMAKHLLHYLELGFTYVVANVSFLNQNVQIRTT
ncbi:hypothetical protein GJ496_007893 [Pomphorhynchus laevis]|nr:hypothetical protein GJ496_007893 [Pomphorhynchus laevis]